MAIARMVGVALMSIRSAPHLMMILNTMKLLHQQCTCADNAGVRTIVESRHRRTCAQGGDASATPAKLTVFALEWNLTPFSLACWKRQSICLHARKTTASSSAGI